MKATVLIDNMACGDLCGEWGLCVYIEYGDKVILLDAGGSDLFLTNAEKLGLSIERVDHAVLSHAHYDHSLGMPGFFRTNEHAKFYLREGAAENCYKRDDVRYVYDGMPEHVLTDYSDRIEFVSGDHELMEGVWLIPHKLPGRSAMGKRDQLYVKNGGWHYDDYSHEQSLVFDTEQGLVIFNSCSHGGAANIIREVADTFPDKSVRAMIGGFHLYNKTEEEIRELADRIQETGIEYVCTGHCTGEPAYQILKEELGDKLHQLHTGLVMEF